MAKNRNTKKPKKEKNPQVNLAASGTQLDVLAEDTVQAGQNRKGR
ncbi:MAG: hypothetical protein M0021_06390 [Clostridia bacterium]|nr:hypothetical protein [Clostridia bacterium]